MPSFITSRLAIVNRAALRRKTGLTGQYFYHLHRREVNPRARDSKLQDALIAACERLSGIKLPQG